MDCFFYFYFRGSKCGARAFFSFERNPYFIFLWLYDSELVLEFSDEISIKTDLEQVLPRKNDYASLVDLELTLFEALQKEPEFIRQKSFVYKKDKVG